ncbi:MAG: hypothetical protein QOH13_1347, partial [Thermoleophilaceae bacterium]|nr:hypothetical protein [Thermoleophilaceae bacterium]
MRVTIPSRRTRELVTTYGSALPILLGTIALMVTLAQHGGYFVTDWYPAGLVLLGLLAVALVSTARMRPPRAVVVAVALLIAYAAWSYGSISWSHQRGLAWDGANRTMLYAIVFALFAWRPLPGRAAGVLVGLLTAAAAGIGLAELVHLLGAANPRVDFIGGRLSEPVGYPNGDAVLFTMGLFLCAGIMCVRSLASPLRGASFGGAVLLGGLALMAQSRGWLFILPV